MSAQQHDFPKTTVKQFVLALLGGLIAPGLVIFLIFKLVMGIQATHIEDSDVKVASAAVAERVQPVASVEVAAEGEAAPAAGQASGKSGEEVVKGTCAMCHGAGVMGAPKIGDKTAWEPRIAQGKDTLVKNAINGIRTMPAKGGNASLSDDEVAGAVVFMANQAGAGF